MYFNFTSYNDLPRRAQNIVDKLGGIDNTIEYYENYRSFLRINGSGHKTNEELKAFCEFLLDEKNIKETNLQGEIIVPENYPDLLDFYLFAKKKVKTRVFRCLNNLELKEYFNRSIEDKYAFINKYFIADYEFIKIHNIGLDSVSILNQLKNEISELIIYNSKVPILKTQEQNKTELIKDIYRKLEYNVDIQNIENSFLTDELIFEFPILFGYYFAAKFKNTNSINFINYNYFNNTCTNLAVLCDKLKLTKERIRQLVIKFSKTIIPSLVNELKKSLLGIENSFNLIEPNYIYYFPNTYYESGNLFIDSINLDFKLLVFKSYFNNKFLLFNDFFNSNLFNSKSFELTTSNIFVNVKFVESTSLIKLLEWLDSEIYNFKMAEFDFELPILIKRFYSENNLDVNHIEFNNLVELIVQIEKKDFEIGIAIIKRKERENLLKLVHSFILEKNEPQKTKSILDYLQENFIEQTKGLLLNILNKNTSRFQRVGNGYWAISEFENNLHGSIRDLVFNKLNKSNKPIHISEIMDFLNAIRPITEESLRSNLKSHEQKIFRFFGCGFIGLVNFKYDDFYNNLPRFAGGMFNKIFFNLHGLDSNEKIIDYFSEKYNYPKIHIAYVLKNKEV